MAKIENTKRTIFFLFLLLGWDIPVEATSAADCAEIPLGKEGNGITCRWDTKKYFNNRPALRQSKAHVCNAMIMSMAIETAYSIDDQQKHDISVQAILDCFVPDKCFPDEENQPKGCTMYSIFHQIDVSSKELQDGDGRGPAYGIFLNKEDYPRQYNPDDPKKQQCEAHKFADKWAKKPVEYKLYKGGTGLELDFIVDETLDIEGMMKMLKLHPMIVNTKTTRRMAQYQLTSAKELEDLDNAFDLEQDEESDLLPFNHSFYVIGYVKPEDPSIKHVYFLVKTCLTGEKPWGWEGKGFLKMSTAKGGVYAFNDNVYSVVVKN